MRKVRELLVVLTLTIIFCVPARQVNAEECFGWQFEIRLTYYSDYFATYVGSYEQYCCEEEFYTDGTLDGAYKMRDWTNCKTSEYHRTCYQKVSGNWVPINCP